MLPKLLFSAELVHQAVWLSTSARVCYQISFLLNTRNEHKDTGEYLSRLKLQKTFSGIGKDIFDVFVIKTTPTVARLVTGNLLTSELKMIV